MTDQEREVVVDAACALLKAAILFRDLAEAMPVRAFADMPSDIRGRMLSYEYQEAFDQLPADVRQEAQRQAMADPLIQQARGIHQQANRSI